MPDTCAPPLFPKDAALVTRPYVLAALWQPIMPEGAAAAHMWLMLHSHWHVQVVLAALVIADCTSFMPRNPNENDDPILQASFLACVASIRLDNMHGP